VLRIFLRVVEAHLRRSCPGVSARARFGAVSFVHRFGASLNRHLHYHCCILDGVFEPLEGGGVQFRQASALTREAAAVIESQVRRRVLRWLSHHGLLDPDDARDMLTWEHCGFSLDASVCIAGHDRAGLERLLRYCARPPLALERIEQVNDERVVYRLPKPRRDGRTALSLTPLELIDHLVALIPPPRLHRHRYHGVLAPNAPLRLAATAYGRDADPDLTHPPPVAAAPPPSPPAAAAPSHRCPAHYLWAMLLARLFESLPLVCPNCDADMRIVAFITEAAPVRRNLKHVGEPAEPPRISPARGPPGWNDPPVEAVPDWDALAQPQPEYVFNQEVQWQPPSVVATHKRPAPPCTQVPANHPSAPSARTSSPPSIPVGALAGLATALPAMLTLPPLQPPVRLNFLSLSLISPRRGFVQHID
jgi:hypothetical protein